MMRIVLRLEYDGSRYHGFQLQPVTHGVTVQGEVERHLAAIAAADTRIVCAGRTDSGVHATAQYVHFECAAARPLRAWTRGLDRKLGPALAVRSAHVVDAAFHARFSALERRYVYLIDDSGSPPVTGHALLGASPVALDVDQMHAAARHLRGEHDFSSFRAAGCQAASPVRTITATAVYRVGQLVVVDVTANAFLQHMVRNMVGALLAVGRAEVRGDWLAELLARRDRTAAPPTAAPGGLYLVDVRYPDAFALPRGPFWPSMLRAAGHVDGSDRAHRAPLP